MRISEIQELAQMLSQLTDEERKLLERNEAKARKANGKKHEKTTDIDKHLAEHGFRPSFPNCGSALIRKNGKKNGMPTVSIRPFPIFIS